MKVVTAGHDGLTLFIFKNNFYTKSLHWWCVSFHEVAKITCVYKAGDQKNVSKNRPISVLTKY